MCLLSNAGQHPRTSCDSIDLGLQASLQAHGQISTYKNIQSLEDPHCLNSSGTLETSDHIFISCPFTFRLWEILGISPAKGDQSCPWLLSSSLNLPQEVGLDMMPLVSWLNKITRKYGLWWSRSPAKEVEKDLSLQEEEVVLVLVLV